jgi:hypothetical protein
MVVFSSRNQTDSSCAPGSCKMFHKQFGAIGVYLALSNTMVFGNLLIVVSPSTTDAVYAYMRSGGKASSFLNFGDKWLDLPFRLSHLPRH